MNTQKEKLQHRNISNQQNQVEAATATSTRDKRKKDGGRRTDEAWGRRVTKKQNEIA